MVKLNFQKIIQNVENNLLKKNLPILKVGDRVKIGIKIIENNSERLQFSEGTIIAKKNSSINTTITVQNILQGIRIRQIFLIHSPKLDYIKVLSSSKVRRAKLYYLVNLKEKNNYLKQIF